MECENYQNLLSVAQLGPEVSHPLVGVELGGLIVGYDLMLGITLGSGIMSRGHSSFVMKSVLLLWYLTVPSSLASCLSVPKLWETRKPCLCWVLAKALCVLSVELQSAVARVFPVSSM